MRCNSLANKLFLYAIVLTALKFRSSFTYVGCITSTIVGNLHVSSNLPIFPGHNVHFIIYQKVLKQECIKKRMTLFIISLQLFQS